MEKTALLASSGDWRETRVMTVHVSKLRRRSASDEEKADEDTTRLFVKPTMRFLPLPLGTGAPAVSRRSQDDAKAKAGGARGLSPTGVTPHGPVVTSQPAQARRGTDATNANAGAAKGTSPAGTAPQGPGVLSPGGAGRPTTGVKKASTGAAIGTSPVGVTPKSPTATSKRPSMLPPSQPPVPPAELPKVQPSSTRASQSAAPLAGVPGLALEPGATAPGEATPIAGAGSLTPYSPVLESEMFEGSESVNEPEYELSDTTILDVNPCLLLPLSGCNFLLIVVSVVVFLAALYAYFEEESTPAATSPNTWLVYLFLHLEAVLMVASLAVFLVASVGFLGALRENIDLLNLYTTLQGSFVTAEVIFVFMVFFLPVIGREFVISHITTELIVHYRDNQDYQNEIDYVQSSLRCCGMTENAYLDWNANQYFNCSPTNPSAERCSVPPSCCRQKEVPDIADYDTSTTEPKEAFEDTKIEEIERGASVEDDVYVTTLCGRGVMKLKERDAWKSRVIEIALYTCIVILGHLILTALAVNVRNEITALVKVYDKYYKVVYRGQKRMKLNLLDEEAASPQASPQGPPLVASKEARRQRHRRRYLDARPPYKELPKDVAAAGALCLDVRNTLPV
ncbi:hypothetical protein HPB50_026767 [Hyalomma asiaticum]|uniref:Uncharacterized protein n=1 Tax=Hyalomma asiaticum TaxID=266040 RepID=A0ACB7RZ79_HYAAI|nr:hypothetical protein HPB50_026767 [Hyalomma asiaticum]